jgi:hypothetical protein
MSACASTRWHSSADSRLAKRVGRRARELCRPDVRHALALGQVGGGKIEGGDERRGLAVVEYRSGDPQPAGERRAGPDPVTHRHRRHIGDLDQRRQRTVGEVESQRAVRRDDDADPPLGVDGVAVHQPHAAAGRDDVERRGGLEQ